MYLLDKPFVSDFLIDTMRKNKSKIIATQTAKDLLKDNSLNWVSEQEAIATMKSTPNMPLYTNSENGLSWIDQNLGDHKLVNQYEKLKDKVKFRELITKIFPSFYFKKVKLSEIQNISTDTLPFPFVIKPSKGFFNIGVHIVKNEEDWLKAKYELTPENLNGIFPEEVLNASHFIIEEYIEGEEYAIDYYYNQKGDVVVLNISHRLFSTSNDRGNWVYLTSKEIILKHKTEIENILETIGKDLELRNFPAHAEVKIDKNGKITPIEINPLRFGGWCTTGELLGVTLGLNSYEYFFENTTPDWDNIFLNKENKVFGIIILENNSDIKSADIISFDYQELSNSFEKPIKIREFDIQKHPVFGFVFIESEDKNKKEIYDILNSDLKGYMTIT